MWGPGAATGSGATDARGESSRDRLERVRRHLELHYADSVTLDLLAGIAGLSPWHLTRSFTVAYGLSPHVYQTRLRLFAAREQLARGVRPAEIEVGFADQSHLTRQFKRYFGTTPAAFARSPSLHGAELSSDAAIRPAAARSR
ncbi:MAG TPA: AraC family transcriptional regulator [Thermoanaerobaculia bacterium]|nr:AraC family transcriptional regulator [Thermoanaerobaculia bacterium]